MLCKICACFPQNRTSYNAKTCSPISRQSSGRSLPLKPIQVSEHYVQSVPISPMQALSQHSRSSTRNPAKSRTAVVPVPHACAQMHLLPTNACSRARESLAWAGWESPAPRHLTAQHVVPRGSESPGFLPWLSTFGNFCHRHASFLYVAPSAGTNLSLYSVRSGGMQRQSVCATHLWRADLAFGDGWCDDVWEMSVNRSRCWLPPSCSRLWILEAFLTAELLIHEIQRRRLHLLFYLFIFCKLGPAEIWATKT